MSEQDYELLSQFIDNELESTEAQTLRKRLLAEPGLRAELDRMRAVNDRVKDAFDVPGADAVPATVAARLQGGERDRKRTWGLAVAASLVAAAGLVLAPQWQEVSQGTRAGDTMLAQVLEQAPSRAQGWNALTDGRMVRPVLSFSNQEGNWCREFLLSDGGDSFRGVACRTDSQWQTVALGAADLDRRAGEYRPAGATDADEVASYINAHAADIPLSLTQETDLIARNWQ
jgi:hypothetical protein